MSDFGELWKHKKTQHALNKLGLGNATLLQLAFLGESDPYFPWEKLPLGHQSVQNTKYYTYIAGTIPPHFSSACRHCRIVLAAMKWGPSSNISHVCRAVSVKWGPSSKSSHACSCEMGSQLKSSKISHVCRLRSLI